MIAGSAACSAALLASRLLPAIELVDCAKLVWVSLLPHRKQVTCFCGGSLAHGVAGPIVSGRSVPATVVCWPGNAHEMLLVGVAAAAIAGSGQACVNHAAPPLPASMSNVRLISCALAANATSLPAVRSRIS